MINIEKTPRLIKLFNITVIGLVLLDIILLTALIFINNINPQLYQFILYFDLFVVIILIAQFIHEFKNSTNRTKYLKDNWFDLVGMVPEIVLPGIGTFLRYFRLIRILSLFRRNLANFFNFLEKTHLEYGIITLIFILISAASVFYFFEHGVNPNVNSVDDAVWYALITLTTVGFGDITPQTIGGRVATVLIIVSGIGFVSYLAASISRWIFEITRKEDEEIEEDLDTFREDVKNQLTSIQKDIEEIKRILDEKDNR